MGGPSISAKLPAVGAVLAAIGAMAASPTQSDAGRSTGAYAYVPASDAAACAIACAQDSICLAWSFSATELVGCSLKAIVPQGDDATNQSGIAARAEQFLSLTTLRKPAPPAPSAPAVVVQAAEAPLSASPISARLLSAPQRPSFALSALTSFVAPPSAEFAAEEAPIEAAALPHTEPLAALERLSPRQPAPIATPSLGSPALAEPAELPTTTWVNATPLPTTPQIRAPGLATATQLRMATAAPLEQGFSPPESYLRVALAPQTPAVRASAPAPLAAIRFATAAALEEPFVATAPSMRVAVLAVLAKPRANALPGMAALYIEHPVLIDPPPQQVATAERDAALSQMRLAVQPVMLVASATTATARPYQPVAAQAATTTEALTPGPAAEEDLLGGPDTP